MGILPPPFSHRLPVVTAPISCPRGTPRSSALHIPQFPPLCFFSTAPPARPNVFLYFAQVRRGIFIFFFGIQRVEAAQLQVPSGIWRGRKLGTGTKCFFSFPQSGTNDKQQKLSNSTTPLCLISPSHTSIFSPSLYFSFTVLLHLPPSPQAPSTEPPPHPTSSLLVFFLFLSEVGRVGGWLAGSGGGALCLSGWLGKLPARRARTSLWVFADFIIFIIGRLPPWQSH